jgi:hypothetical protein
MESKSYKNLGNAIRESVFNIKEAPTMLPDETIEKLGLSEDDILSMEEGLPEVDEARSFKSSFEQRKTAEQLATQLSRQINNINLPDSDSVRYERPGNSWKKDEAQATKQLDKIISQLESLSKLVSRSTL